MAQGFTTKERSRPGRGRKARDMTVTHMPVPRQVVTRARTKSAIPRGNLKTPRVSAVGMGEYSQRMRPGSHYAQKQVWQESYLGRLQKFEQR